MFIKSIIINGNKRLLPADIKFLHITFTNVHQIILGLNGSGKSTTVQELNPMPASPSDYLKGGYKHILIEHRGQDYELLSLIDTSSRHSFKLNGIELNDGGTGSVQKMLVLEHFNLDQALVEVLTDQARFHLFSPNERRNWLTRLSGTNMDYAIGLFKYLKSLHRDSEAIVKHIDARLAKESADVMAPEELEELEAFCKELESSVLTLLEHKSLNETNPQHTLDELTRLTTECQRLSEDIIALRFKKPLEGIYNRSRLIDYKHFLDNRLSVLTQEKENLVKEWSEIKEAIKTVEMTENKDIGEIDKEKQSYLDEREKLKSELKRYKVVVNPEPLFGATDAIKNTLIHKVTELSDNSDSMFTRDKVNEYNEMAADIRALILKTGNELEGLRVSLGRMVEIEEVHCPSCATVFKPGVDPTLVKSLQEKGRNKTEEIESLKKKLEEVNDYLSQARTYTEEYRSLLRLMDDAPSLELVWCDMKSLDLKEVPPESLLEVFENWERDLGIHLQCLKITQEIAKLDGAKDKLQAVKDSEVNYSQSRLTAVETAITTNLEEQKSTREQLTKANESIVTHDDLMNGYERFVALNAKHRNLKDKYMEESVQKELRDTISRLNLQLANSSSRLQVARSSRTTLLDLEEQKQEAIKRRETLKALVKELNPTDGLIAKQSKLFIEQFVEQLNTVINAVWTYEMQILPCPVESDKLTYKFPIYFSATDVANPDIAKSSAAQKGIVDFAFKLVVMAYLGLTDYPLYLDELAPSLDEKHRANIMVFVKNFVESKQCSQMFQISHYVDSHGMFTAAEVMVLDDTNLLTLPEKFNKHVVISSTLRPWKELDTAA